VLGKAQRRWFYDGDDDTDTGWVVLALDLLCGRHPEQPWRLGQLQLALDGLTELAERLTPFPLPIGTALIDPLRDVDQCLDVARREGVCITHVLETHLRNDFLSGGRELAAVSGARIVASKDAGLEFDHQPVRDGDIVAVGEVRISVLATHGHTPEHVSYLAQDTSRPEDPPVLFSGGSLLVGAVSRTDLLGHEHATGLAHQLYRTLHERILPLADDVVVYPTHGAGSFCTAAATQEAAAAESRADNRAHGDRGRDGQGERVRGRRRRLRTQAF
jgi:glyoxylase-like metal-dependent hydrolase (beta-lactamase superfamily II)